MHTCVCVCFGVGRGGGGGGLVLIDILVLQLSSPKQKFLAPRLKGGKENSKKTTNI